MAGAAEAEENMEAAPNAVNSIPVVRELDTTDLHLSAAATQLAEQVLADNANSAADYPSGLSGLLSVTMQEDESQHA